jgi:hypothetical protein
MQKKIELSFCTTIQKKSFGKNAFGIGTGKITPKQEKSLLFQNG